MAKIKKPLLFSLCILPIAIVAGVFVGLYQIDICPDDVLREAISQLGSTEILIAVSTV